MRRTATILMLALCSREKPEMTTPALVCPKPGPVGTPSSDPPIRTALLGKPTTQLLEIPCRSDGEVTGVRLSVQDESFEPQPFTATPLELVELQLPHHLRVRAEHAWRLAPHCLA